mmetsp:Transcript_41034/g.87549  ORF Transcript_41034/g.87549 Transcript_41034/m.87549 type:complete len:270 (+) Transcript_41034:479-1288(+)
MQQGGCQADDCPSAPLRPQLPPGEDRHRAGRGGRGRADQAHIARSFPAAFPVRQGRRRHLQGHGGARPRHGALSHGLRARRDPRLRLVHDRRGHPRAARARGLRHGRHRDEVRQRQGVLHRRLPPGALRLRPTRGGAWPVGDDHDRQQLSQHRAYLLGRLHRQRRHALRLLHVALQRGIRAGDAGLRAVARHGQPRAVLGRGRAHRAGHGHRCRQIGHRAPLGQVLRARTAALRTLLQPPSGGGRGRVRPRDHRAGHGCNQLEEAAWRG